MYSIKSLAVIALHFGIVLGSPIPKSGTAVGQAYSLELDSSYDDLYDQEFAFDENEGDHEDYLSSDLFAPEEDEDEAGTKQAHPHAKKAKKEKKRPKRVKPIVDTDEEEDDEDNNVEHDHPPVEPDDEDEGFSRPSYDEQ
ncbi:hypothetical protein HDV02_000536 [Globomyces sp. JEL0801]|nr:hypothetical protein HDV02_000536 [Globomyces sp. JEL0801]